MANTMQLSVFSILLFCVAVQAELRFGDKCPKFTTVQDFKAAEYVGKWFEYARLPTIFEQGGKCITATYAAMENGDISVDNQQINEKTKEPKSIKGFAKVDGPGELSVTFPSLPFSIPAPYKVLDTDYKTYASVYSCTKYLGVLISEFGWMLTREANPSAETVQKARDAFTRNGIDASKFVVTNQTDCTQ